MSDTAKSQDDLSIEEILGSIRRIIAEDDDDNDMAPQQKSADTAAAQTMQQASINQAPINDVADDMDDFGDDDFDDEEPLVLTNKIEPQDDAEDIALEPADAMQEEVTEEIAIQEMDEVAFDADEAMTQENATNMDEAAQSFAQPSVADDSAETDELTDQADPAICPVQEGIATMTQNQDDAALKDNALLSSNTAIATAAVMAKLARQAAITEEGNNNVTLEAMVKEMIRPMLREWLDANLPDLVQKMVERELERLTKRL